MAAHAIGDALPVPRDLARFVLSTGWADLPEAVRREGPRAFLNWLGCVYGGLHDPTYETAYRALGAMAGKGRASVLGRARRIDPIGATFFNTLSSCTHAFDDTHLATIAHPSGPAAAAAFTAAELMRADGKTMLAAMLLGIEVQCRVANMLAKPPAKTALGFYMTGLTGALGAAAAAGKILGLDEQRMIWALGIAAAQGAGFRQTHATMSNGFVRANAARSGMVAAVLAKDGFTCADNALEGGKGFAAVFGQPADLSHAIDGLGTRYELLDNAYKPYPCAIVIHPIIDACLDLAARADFTAADIASLELDVNPASVKLSSIVHPHDVEDARISLFHWAAAALIRRKAGVTEGGTAAANDPEIAALRGRIVAREDAKVMRQSARACLRLTDGRILESQIENARGSAAAPMSDDELKAKFSDQAAAVMTSAHAEALIDICWTLPERRNATSALVKRDRAAIAD